MYPRFCQILAVWTPDLKLSQIFRHLRRVGKVKQENCICKSQNKLARYGNLLLFDHSQRILTVACSETLNGSDLIIQQMRLQNDSFITSHESSRKTKTDH